MWIEQLHGVERALETAHGDGLAFQVHVVDSQVSDFAGTHSVTIGDQHHRPIARASFFRPLQHGDHFVWYQIALACLHRPAPFGWKSFNK